MVDPRTDDTQLDELKIEAEDRYNKNSAKRESTVKTVKRKSHTAWYINLIITAILIMLIFISGYYALQMLQNSSSVQEIFKEMKPHIYAKYQKNGTTSNDDGVVPSPVANITTESAQSNVQADQQRITVSGNAIDELEHANNNATLNLTAEKKSENELALDDNLPDTHYTIEIATSMNLNRLLDLIKQYQLENYQVYEMKQYGESIFKLIKGNYASRDEAEKAITKLPETIQQTEIWVKLGSEINREKKNSNYLN